MSTHTASGPSCGVCDAPNGSPHEAHCVIGKDIAHRKAEAQEGYQQVKTLMSITAHNRVNAMAEFVHALNYKNFYHDINTGQPLNRNLPELLCLMHSEISECMEGVRKNTQDSHLPLRKTEEVELADLMIRVLDYAGYRNLDLQGAINEKLAYNCARKDHTAEERRKANGKKF